MSIKTPKLLFAAIASGLFASTAMADTTGPRFGARTAEALFTGTEFEVIEAGHTFRKHSLRAKRYGHGHRHGLRYKRPHRGVVIHKHVPVHPHGKKSKKLSDFEKALVLKKLLK